jgi:diacylglycerol kinase (ATP)
MLHRTIVAIVNPKSGGGKAARLWAHVQRRLAQPVETRYTQKEGQAIELTAEALKRGARTIIAVGGDGTINEVVNGFFENDRLIAPDVALAIVPHGTGSDFVRTVPLPLEPQKAASLIAEGAAQPIDVARLHYTTMHNTTASRYFINVASFGMGGAVAANAKRFTALLGSRAGFLTSTILTLVGFSGTEVTVRFDGAASVEATITNVAIGNGQFHGAGMRVCPRAAIDDGMLDVTLIRYLGTTELIRRASVLYNGRIYEHPKVEFHRARQIVAESKQQTFIEADGELLGQLPIQVSILPSAIRLLGNH